MNPKQKLVSLYDTKIDKNDMQEFKIIVSSNYE